METVVINLGIFALIGSAMAIPTLLLARYTRSHEHLGNREIGLLVQGFESGKDSHRKHTRG